MLDVIYAILNDLSTNGHCSYEMLYTRCSSSPHMKDLSNYGCSMHFNIRTLQSHSFITCDDQVSITSRGEILLSAIKYVKEMTKGIDPEGEYQGELCTYICRH